MLLTPNYSLKKIELTDSPPDITVINSNWDTIDSTLKTAADGAAGAIPKSVATAADLVIVSTANATWGAKTKVQFITWLGLLVSSISDFANGVRAVVMTGYAKAASYSAVAATDTVNQAIGKLEKGLEGKAALTGAVFTGSVHANSFSQTPANYGVSPLEIGKYIDFHEVGSTTDFDSRFQLIDGFLEIYNPLGATSGKSQQGRILTRPALITGNDTSFTLDLSYAEGRLWAGGESDITITIPKNSVTAFPVGTSIDIIRGGAGEITFAAVDGDVSILSVSGYKKILASYGAVSLVKIATDIWVLIGALKA